MKKHLLLILSLFPLSLPAQHTCDWEQYFERMAALDEMDNETLEQAYETLTQLSLQPLDINHIAREDLEQLPFLSEQQIEDICAYVHYHAPLKSLGELAMIESLDAPVRQLLQQFLCIGDDNTTTRFPSLTNILKYGKNNLLITAKTPLHRKNPDTEDNYLGYSLRHDLRYTFSYGDYVKAGIVGAQDAGEPFFANKNTLGYDHYAWFLVLRKLGRLKTLALGQYRLHLGMGLIMNTDFFLGKQATLQSLSNRHSTLRANSSRTEADYLQGAAATIQLSNTLDATLFASYRPIDATLTTDSLSIATILTTGYHRTPTEMNKKHNASQFLTGGNIAFRSQGWHLGASILYTQFSKPLHPNTSTLYRRYYPEGNHFCNMSADYGYTSRRITFSGETATDDNGALATINNLRLQPTSSLSFIALQRFYSYRYHALFARSFSDGGHVQNESGIYFGATYSPLRQLQLAAYTDYAYYPWARMGISLPSHSWDHLLTASWQQGAFAIDARYRLQRRQRDNTEHTALDNYTQQRARIALSYSIPTLTLHTQADATFRSQSHGFMISQRAQFNIANRHQIHALVGYFNTTDYQSRIYLYERSMRYTFSFPFYYGEGIRYAFLAQTAVSNNLQLTARIATTNHFSQPTTSETNNSSQRHAETNLEMQLHWKF